MPAAFRAGKRATEVIGILRIPRNKSDVSLLIIKISDERYENPMPVLNPSGLKQ
jgi:hypothetical protein